MDNNKKFWERVAKLYTPLQEKANSKTYGEVLKYCEKYITKDRKVLELACGTGQFTFCLCNKALSWEATDFSDKMIQETVVRSKQIIGEENSVTFSVQDATNLKYEDKTFDIVLIANALHIMPEPKKALKEIKRVLKDDGIVLAPTFVYEGKINKVRMFIMQLAGFKTFHKWNKKEYESFVEKEGFGIKESILIPGSPLPEDLIVGEK